MMLKRKSVNLRLLRVVLVLCLSSGILAAACSGGAEEGSQEPSASTAPPDRGSSSSGPAEARDPAAGPPCPAAAGRDLDLRYAERPGVDPRWLSLDVYRPVRSGACAAAPVVVWVHGGGWRQGDKRNGAARKAARFNAEGWVFVSVNYRLTDASVPEADRVMYPDHNDDVAAAVAWLHDHAAEYGLDVSDPTS